MTLRTLNYGSYGIFLFLGNAGFISSTVVLAITKAFFRAPVSARAVLDDDDTTQMTTTRPPTTQGTQYPLIKEYAFNYGLHIMI